MSILSFSSAAFADQSSYQSVSGSTSASGANTASMSRTEQSVYQSGVGTQQLWQNVEAGTLSEGNGTAATTQIDQVATQDSIGAWAESHTQQLLQQAGISNAALGDRTTTESSTSQNSTQVLVEF
ncbi:MAG: hypothetical protein ACFB16_21330 [Phormidesmis sp.]